MLKGTGKLNHIEGEAISPHKTLNGWNYL